MLKLIDLLNLAGIDLGTYKIHCATKSVPNDPSDPFFGGSGDPLDVFLDGRFDEWQAYQSGRNFQCDHVLSLISTDRDIWLLAGVYQVLGCRDGRPWTAKGVTYETELVPGLEHLVGKAYIRFARNFRAAYLLGSNFGDKLIVESIQSQRVTTGDFPGFNKCFCTFQQLKRIVRENNPSWKSALSSVSGIYVITDGATGKQYIGKACGGDGIWGRWVSYANVGHGNNKELTALLKEKGTEYSGSWQIAVLEVCDLNAGEDEIDARESYWKEALLTRKFGLNAN